MVPPAPVVADHGNSVLEILFPNHIIRFSKEKIDEAIINQQPIGEGTTSIVYRGVIDEREVAIKRILPDYAEQFEVLSDFKNPQLSLYIQTDH